MVPCSRLSCLVLLLLAAICMLLLLIVLPGISCPAACKGTAQEQAGSQVRQLAGSQVRQPLWLECCVGLDRLAVLPPAFPSLGNQGVTRLVRAGRLRVFQSCPWSFGPGYLNRSCTLPQLRETPIQPLSLRQDVLRCPGDWCSYQKLATMYSYIVFRNPSGCSN